MDAIRGLDLRRVENNLRAKLSDWRALLTRNVGAARQALRGLVPERLIFTPKEQDGERVYEFSGVAVLDRILNGIVLPTAGVAPTGFEPVYESRPRFAKSSNDLTSQQRLVTRCD